MKVINHHKRVVNRPKKDISNLIEKLASNEDRIWPYDKWSAMKFKDGLKVGSKGGHGIIGYTIVSYDPAQGIVFQFSSPKGFVGTHEFKIVALDVDRTEVSHIIKMRTQGKATLQWLVFIRWLHDALIEDALDNIENHFSKDEKVSNWSAWVRLWRWIFTKTKRSRLEPSLGQHG